MSTILVERSFDAPRTFDELQAAEDAHAWCLETNAVSASHSYMSRDGRRMVCVYAAPDAEAVRRAQRQAGLPFDTVWSSAEFGIEGAMDHAPETTVAMVDRTYPAPPTAEAVAALQEQAAWCLESHTVISVSLYVEARGTRGLCVYVAPDLESVRRANRTAHLPVDAIWAAVLKRPSR